MTPRMIAAASLMLAAGSAMPVEEGPGQSEEELAKAAQNPVADLISIPFQHNANFGYGLRNDQTQNVLNIQPVIPFKVAPEWNLITRTIVPLVWQPSFTDGNTEFGIGNISWTGFLSPAQPGGLIWGIGPVISFPTATSRFVGSQSTWGLGPSAVALTMPGDWVVGALVSNVWSIAGATSNNLLLQYFVNYNFGTTGWYLTSSPIITANWEAPGGPSEKWVVPFGAGVGKLLRLGRLPVNTSLAAYYNVASPSIGPQWSFRAQAAILLPTWIFTGKK